jgi:1,4-alpha-glucan branching enzyme
MKRRPALILCALSLFLPGKLRGAAHDGNVEWDGVLSLPEDRSPLHPGKNQDFTVELRVFKDDITAARVRTWDGSEHFYPMVWARNDPSGLYDIWRAAVTGTGGDYLYYRFEITDGADTDYYNSLGMWDNAPPSGDFLVVTTSWGGYPLGATPVAGGSGVVFRVWGPDAAAATVAGSFNGWSTGQSPLKNVQGFWEGMVPAARAGDPYKLVFEGSIWRTDPRARRQENSIGNSLVANPSAYLWGDGTFRMPGIADLIIYELHVGSFSGEGDGVLHSPARFRDAADAHLTHLSELGINAVELMPVAEFAGDRSWGYNPTFQYAPESAYGAPDDLKYLVDRCHQRGMAVLIDVVYNHMGPGDLSGNLLEYDGKEIYFYPTGNGYRETPWGPRPDYGRVEVREFLRDNAHYWLEEFHADGLRVDATDFIKVNGDGWRLLRELGQTVQAARPGSIVIAEQLPNDPAVTRPIAAGGAGLDAQWHDAFHDNLRAAVKAAAFGDPDFGALAAAINHFAYPATQLVNYIESHDEAANQGRVCVAADPANHASPWAYGRSKFAAGLVLFTAGIPMLLQGQEFLEDRPFGDSEDKRIQWKYRTEHSDFLLFMKDAVALRRSHPGFRATAAQDLFHVNDGANVLAFHRWDGADDLVVVASLSNQDFADYGLSFPRAGDWYELLNSDSSAYGGGDFGNGGRVTASGSPATARIKIPQMGLLVFSATPPPPRTGFLRGDSNGDRALDISDPIQMLFVLFSGVPAGDCPAAADADGDGKADITDPIYALSFLFRSGPAPAAPWPACGAAAGGLPCSRSCP